MQKALEIGPLVGIPAIGLRPVPLLPFPRFEQEISWFAELETRLKRAFALSKEVAYDGVITHLNHHHHHQTKGDVVFRGAKELLPFEIYTDLLQMMEFSPESLQVVLRRVDGAEVPGWARRRLKRFAGYSVHRIAPPVLKHATSYAPWVGLHLLDSTGTAWAKSSQTAMFLSAISAATME